MLILRHELRTSTTTVKPMTECNLPACSNSVGLQDRDDYRDNKFCCIQHEIKLEHLKTDAKDAKRSVDASHDTEGYF